MTTPPCKIACKFIYLSNCHSLRSNCWQLRHHVVGRITTQVCSLWQYRWGVLLSLTPDAWLGVTQSWRSRHSTEPLYGINCRNNGHLYNIIYYIVIICIRAYRYIYIYIYIYTCLWIIHSDTVSYICILLLQVGNAAGSPMKNWVADSDTWGSLQCTWSICASGLSFPMGLEMSKSTLFRQKKTVS